MNVKETKLFLQELHTFPRKHLGQNFLINSQLSRKIVCEVKQTKGPWIEIGPGSGALTRLFSEEEKKILTLIEKDKKIANYWKEKNYSVLMQDALKIHWTKLPYFTTLFGNLPYQIAGPLLLKTSVFSKQMDTMILMMQKEVSLRVRAKPKTKDYGLLSVIAQTFWHIQWIAEAGTQDFYPPPKVAGHVLRFQAKISPVPGNEFLTFLKSCFAQRRKKLIHRLPISLSQAETLLSEINRNTNTRAEELTPEEFIFLFQEIQSRKSSQD
ncbi:MAG: 16S rRNA (adenine(1518)-N(6)/adenine(1519)-N(6))-dimethyltransferase RsmA [Bdellovibrionales bacterium]|nr:16S rRNA (adenine(1518)-N(6)/adenine(1519)-N(6))-dimethyltransferase RsmA [Bdellovibrionales bacterium]